MCGSLWEHQLQLEYAFQREGQEFDLVYYGISEKSSSRKAFFLRKWRIGKTDEDKKEDHPEKIFDLQSVKNLFLECEKEQSEEQKTEAIKMALKSEEKELKSK